MITSIQPAGVLKRLQAFGFDYLIISGYAVILAIITFSLTTMSKSLGLRVLWLNDPIRTDLLAFVLLVFPVILYFSLREGSPQGATWGKRRAGLRVINSDGGQLTRSQAIARSVLKFLPWQIAHTCIFHIEGWPSTPTDPSSLVITDFLVVWLMVAAYVGMWLVTRDHRTPYDWATGACVVITA